MKRALVVSCLLVLAGCGDSDTGDSGEGAAGAGGAGGSDATSTGGAGSGCVPHVEPRTEDDGGCDLPCNITQTASLIDFKFCTVSCGPNDECPAGLACHDNDVGFGPMPICEFPCEPGCPDGLACDVESDFCKLE